MLGSPYCFLGLLLPPKILKVQNFINILSCGSFLLTAFLVAMNPRHVNVKANKWLSLFLLSLALMLIEDPFFQTKSYLNYPFLIGLTDVSPYLAASTMYLSIAYFVNPTRSFTKKDLWHFILPCLIALLSVQTFFLPNAEKIRDYELQNEASNFTNFMVFLLLPLAAYWYFSLKKLIQHQQNVQLFASSTESIDLAWLLRFLLGVTLMLLAWVCERFFNLPYITSVSCFINLAGAYYLAHFATQQGAIFSAKQADIEAIQTLIEENDDLKAPKKQRLTLEQVTVLKPKLVDLMQVQKPYLDSELSLPKLAEMLKLTTNELSYLINEGFNDNFFGFVNNYRVEESKRILTTPQYQHLSMVGIAFEAGFNSKTAFNSAFKKMTGISPTDFQKANVPKA